MAYCGYMENNARAKKKDKEEGHRRTMKKRCR
jgi:hypothetical protein